MIGARTIIGLLVAGLGTGFALGSCGSVPASCTKLCLELDRCGMLPGPLGDEQAGRTPVVDCEARCTISTNRSELRGCVAVRMDMDSSPWCDHGACSETATCLRSALGTNQVLGVGSVEVSPVEEEPEEELDCPLTIPGAASAGGTSTGGTSTGGTSTGGTSTGGEDLEAEQMYISNLCMPETVLMFSNPSDGPTRDDGSETLMISPDRVVLELVSDALPTLTIVDGECNGLIGRHFVPDVPVGTYRTQLRVYSTDPSDCVLFEGPLFVVRAGTTVPAEFWINDNKLTVTTTITDENGDPITMEIEVPPEAELCPEVEDSETDRSGTGTADTTGTTTSDSTSSSGTSTG